MTLTDFIIRMLCAFLTGAAIGIERQWRQHNAGLRTNILVSVGSAAFTVISYSLTSSSGDPSRVAAQIVSGIGFIGGGLILKDGFNVRGLNTAATIWCSAACGMFSGAGLYAAGCILVAMVLVTHCLLRPLCVSMERRLSAVSLYTLKVECSDTQLDDVRRLIQTSLAGSPGVRLCSLSYKERREGVVVLCDLETDDRTAVVLDLIVARMRAHFGILNAGWERKGKHEEDF